ncbi:hypothetical protein [Gallibacter sp. Marseille-QA0791]|uniref:hypothetical protein n=1 Tax=Gallibacter sp. Marseille-QA0791 TaxID=3378781 RepID=UPI003D1062F8
MALTQKYKGGLGCERCGEVIKWVRLMSGMWIAVQPEPVLFIPGEGKRMLVEYRNYDAEMIRNCLIYERGKNMDTSKVVKGYMPHAFVCPGR